MTKPVFSVIICNGMKYNTIRNIMAGATIGTMFTPLDMQVILASDWSRQIT